MQINECFKAFSDPVRRDILVLLQKGRMSASDICSHFELTNATVSYHLSVLQKAELIYEQKEGKFIYYSLNISICEEIILWIETLKGGKLNEKNKK